jgi:hypothetical protein
MKVIRICSHWPVEGLQGSISSLHGSTVSVYGPPRLYFEPHKIHNFYFNADPDPAFHSDAEPDPAFTLMRIRIQLPQMMRIHAEIWRIH